MKTRIAVLGLMLVSSLTLAQAGDAATSSGKSPRIAQMEDKLGLTDEQVQKMREIRDSGGSMQDMRAVLTPEQRVKAAQIRKERKTQMQESLGLTDEQKAQMAKIRSSGGSREEMRAILTPEQQAKFDNMRSKRGWQGQAPGEAPAK